MLVTIWKKPQLIILGLGLISLILVIILSVPTTDPRSHLNLEQRLDFALELTQNKLVRTIDYFEQRSRVGTGYPAFTYGDRSSFWQFFKRKPPQGKWHSEDAQFWSAGAFPALLWKMSEQESEPSRQRFWSSYAKSWGEPLRNLKSDTPKDITINNLLVFRPWFETATDDEKKEQLETIFQGARILAQAYDPKRNQGRFHRDIGVMGVKRKATRTDQKVHWQAFTDHIINVEQLLWAAAHNPNQIEAKDWQAKAIQHIQTVGKTFGKNRKPGDSGTWQRGYFNDDSKSTTYGQFLFNEGKQGWRDDSTWSRGQAWVIYGASVTYQYTQDPIVLEIAKEAIAYYIKHLPDGFPGNKRRINDFIPPWDFDYALAKNPDTERDSSAAAIAISGMLKLLAVLPNNDPERASYQDIVEKTLFQLTSKDYLPDLTSPQMSLLEQGCYHHYHAIAPSTAFNNGLIWGDYFFVDALLAYRSMRYN